MHHNLTAGEWTGADPVANINPSDTNEVVGDYNPTRRHSALDYLSPVLFARLAA